MFMLDLRTVFLVASTVNVFLCLALAGYWFTQKTYAGFNLWVLATYALTLLYVLYVLRGIAPDFLTIVVANTFGAVAAVLRLEGTRRFLGETRISRLTLAVPIFSFAFLMYFTYVQESILARTGLLAFSIALPVTIAGWRLREQTNRETRVLFSTLAVLFYLQGAMLLVRFVVWVLWPENRDLFAATPINVTYFFVGIVVEVLLTISYLTLTSQRLTHEWRAAESQRAASEAAERQQRILAEALVDSVAALNSTLNQEQVLTRILENVGRVVPHDTADVMLLEAATNTIQIAGSRGYERTGSDVDIIRSELRLDVTVAPNLAQALDLKRPVIIDDVYQEPGWTSIEAIRWIRSNLTAPIMLRGDVVGFLTLNSAEPAFFQPEHAERLGVFADQAAVAIGNAQLFAAKACYAQELEERNRELDAFAHTVAHDLRNPVSVIIGAAELLSDGDSAGSLEETQEIVASIAHSGRKMNNIIEELLAFSALRTAVGIESAPLDMELIVAEAQGRLGELICDRQAMVEVPLSWPDALGHAPWVEEVWVNLISNAIKYGGSPPHIWLGAERTSGNRIAFWIRDNGCGIPLEQQAQLFGAFHRLPQTRHIEGTGLGLSIVKRIVERMGGTVAVESSGRPGEGCTFRFTLPAATTVS